MPDLVLLSGIPSEGPLTLVADRLAELGVPHVMLSQRAFESSPFEFAIAGGHVTGFVSVEGVRYRLQDFSGVYIRHMDEQLLPELAAEPAHSPRRLQSRAWHDAVVRWCEIAPARVVTRMGAMASNGSKPFQAQAILRNGLRIPETLITSDPACARRFAREKPRVVFKSTSGVRSIVRELDADGLDRLERIRWCPVQFQEYIEGRNVRVHVVGQAAHATAITTDATDYRYAQRQVGDPAELEAVDISDDLVACCVSLAADLSLPFAGIDLKVTAEGEVYCFEVNPSPAYSYYESHTGQPISTALAKYLAGA